MTSYRNQPFGPILPYGGKYGGVRPDIVGDSDLVLLLDKDQQPIGGAAWANGSTAAAAYWFNRDAKFVRYSANHPIYAQAAGQPSAAGDPIVSVIVTAVHKSGNKEVLGTLSA